MPKRKESRSWPTTIIAGLVCLSAVGIGIATVATPDYGWVASLAFFLFAIIAGIIAVQGKRQTLRELIHSAMFLP